MHEWREIVGFAGYSVNDEGLVRNNRFDRLLTQTCNTRGFPIVGLFQNGVQYKRSVTTLVCDAFVKKPYSSKWNTPINLDGDRFNNTVDNIQWRPRWFAVDYYRQFRFGPQGFAQPIEELETGFIFENTWHAAITYGMIERDLVASIVKRTCAFPTFRTYRVISEN